MALTYRSVKGSALTNAELDANFAHFTGSHSVTGSVITSGSLVVTGSVHISGSGLSPFIFANLPVFNGETSNEDAKTAGLTDGMIYRSGDFLCVVNSD
jgi:hypothetical protein